MLSLFARIRSTATDPSLTATTVKPVFRSVFAKERFQLLYDWRNDLAKGLCPPYKAVRLEM
jgi:hypothetical protein